MKKLLIMLLVVTVSVAMLAGCNGNGESVEDGQSTEDASVATSEEVVSEETSDSATAETEISEEVSELTLEEKILAEMPAKLEVGEDEIIVPETVTAEQIMARYEEIKVSDVEYAEDINKENLAGLLVLNCSYMEPAEFVALVNEHFGSVDELMRTFDNYNRYLLSDEGIYGKDCTSVLPEELFFNEYLVNQAEQLHYLFEMYQTDTENSREYYDAIADYIYYDENMYLTFDSNDERLEGSGLVSLQYITSGIIIRDFIDYDTELYASGITSDIINDLRDVVNECANQMSR
ncbi:MAG: hypothetical protein IJD31_05610 [Lachnospiraceae bacterium]|nr:hypothetical protein [Lachnospiraceae bacterium]